MKLTPLDIKKQEFRRTLRGFDPMEVETFLEMVADEYEEIVKEKNRLKDEVTRLKTQLQDYQQVEHTLKETLMNAQESIKRARANSEKESQMIIREAELKAEEIVGKAFKELEKMKNELLIVKAQKDSYANKLRHLIQSQLELLEILEKDDFRWPDEQAATRSHSGEVAPKETPAPEKQSNEADSKGPISNQLIV